MENAAISFSISPCLFIGLGTNGWQMIDELRRLCFEEFGVGGLPCFRYLALETNSEAQEDNSFLPHNPQPYERVRPVYITIPNVEIAQRKIDPSLEAEFSPGLAEWLDPSLINRGSKSYTAGAGHMRQAGRLCLWENWTSFSMVSKELRDAVAKVRSTELAAETDAFIRKEYFAKSKPGVVLPTENLLNMAPKVYILGTLCGGTCSGTFLDIAYFITELLGVRNRGTLRKFRHPEVIGMFTVADTLRMSALPHQVHVANCWAALRELDYYYQSKSVYRVTLPDGQQIENQDEPFDSVYLESMVARSGNGFEGESFKPVVQMCAMSLFTEVVAGMSAKKDEIRINFRAGDSGYLERNSVGCVKALSSYGLSAIWYPRYRITKAIVRNLGVEVCDGWLSSSTLNKAIVDKEVEPLWKRVLERARGSLVGTVTGAHCPDNMERKIEDVFNAKQEAFMALEADALAAAISSFPGGGQKPFSDKLKNPDGEYYLPVANAEKLVGADACREIREFLEAYLRTHSLAEAAAVLEKLGKSTTELEQSIPTGLPILTQNLDTSIAAEVYADKCSAALFMRAHARREYKQALLGDLKVRVRRQLAAVREHMLKQVLRDIQQELTRLSGSLAAMKTRVELLKDTCQREAAEQIAFPHPRNILPISKSGADTLDQDVDFGTREILKNTDRGALRLLFLQVRPDTPLARFDRQVKELLSQLELAFGARARAIVSEFHIGKEALARMRSRIQYLVESSQPYVQTVTTFKPITTTQSPNFIFCNDTDSGAGLSALAEAETVGSTFTPYVSPLDHFIFFYQELPGLAVSDLAISDRGKKILREREKNPNRVATAFLHRLGEKMFDTTAILEVEKVKGWIAATKILAPEAYKKVGGEQAVEFVGENGLIDLLMVDRDESVRAFVEKQRGQDILEHFMRELRKVGKPALQQRMNQELGGAANEKEMGRMRQTFSEVLQQTFV